MTTKQDILLQALHNAPEAGGAGWLEPDRVTDLGTVLGLRPEETIAVAERLRAAGLIEVAWGGKISLTDKGRERASDQAGQGTIYINIAPNGTFVGAGANVSNSAVGAGAISGALGQGAMAQGATRIDVHPGDLVLALRELRHAQALLGPEEQEVVQQLENGVRDIVEEVQKPSLDGATLEKQLDRTKGLLERVAGISDAAVKLGPALKLIARGLEGAGISNPFGS